MLSLKGIRVKAGRQGLTQSSHMIKANNRNRNKILLWYFRFLHKLTKKTRTPTNAVLNLIAALLLPLSLICFPREQ